MKIFTLLLIAIFLVPSISYSNEADDSIILKQELQKIENNLASHLYLDFTHILKLGDTAMQVSQLRIMLDLPAGSKFDKTVQAKVIEFQKSHNLEPSGIVGPATIWALNNSDSDKMRYLRATIAKRENFVPEDRYVLVNIPEYHLYLIDHGKVIFDSKVIVGKSDTGKSGGASPELDSKIVAMLYNPSWHPTHNITMRKLVPKWQRDSNFIQKHHLIILNGAGERVTGISPSQFVRGGYKFYQPPGGDTNALGNLRFTLVNSKNIYLHDTNERELFDHTQRDFSSGCIRVQNWLELATILSGQDSDRIQNKIDTHRTFSESILSIPVHLIYWTAIVKDGKVEYVYDIYKRDKNY
jgi:L,D-transpeptidase YcbB